MAAALCQVCAESACATVWWHLALTAAEAQQYPTPALCITAAQAVVQQFQQLFPSSSPYIHPAVGTAVILPGRGPLPVDAAAAGALQSLVYVIAA